MTEPWGSSLNTQDNSNVDLIRICWRLYLADPSSVLRENFFLRNLLLLNYEIFTPCDSEEISKSTRRRVPNQIAKHVRQIARPPLKDIHKKNWMIWVTQYMTIFVNFCFFFHLQMLSCHGCAGDRCWLTTHGNSPHRLRYQKGGCGVMFWCGIIGSDVVGPWRIPHDVQSSDIHWFLKTHVEPCFKKKPKAFKKMKFFYTWQCYVKFYEEN